MPFKITGMRDREAHIVSAGESQTILDSFPVVGNCNSSSYRHLPHTSSLLPLC